MHNSDNMGHHYRITSATELLSILGQHDGNALGNEISVELALFMPLNDPSMLSASRNASSRFERRTEQGEQSITTVDEYLDLTALGQTWRQAWVEAMKAQAASAITMTFDPTLPNIQTEDKKIQGIWWSVDSRMEPNRGASGLRVIDRDFWCLVVVLATEGRMLSKGSITFKLREGSSSDWWWKSRRLHKQLEALSM